MDLPKDLQSIYKSVNRSGVHRCSICNCVNNENIETNIGDYRSHMSFVNDPKDPSHFICISCEEEIQNLRDEYQYMDEWEEE